MISLSEARRKAKQALDNHYKAVKLLDKMRKNPEKYFDSDEWNSALRNKDKFWKEAIRYNNIITKLLKRPTRVL